MATKRASSTKKLHYHACAHCGWRYPDGCDRPDVNDVCSSCRSGRTSLHHLGLAPRECCRTDSRIANKDDLKMYLLRGSGTWWLCRTCARQFGFNPGNAHV